MINITETIYSTRKSSLSSLIFLLILPSIIGYINYFPGRIPVICQTKANYIPLKSSSTQIIKRLRRGIAPYPFLLFSSYTSKLSTSTIDNSSPFTNNFNNSISTDFVLEFFKNGHVKLPQLFNQTKIESDLIPEILRLYNTNELLAYQHKIKVLFCNDYNSEKINNMSKNECLALLNDVDRKDIPFMQLFNLWSNSTIVKEYSCSVGLGKIAAELLGVSCVRLYQDSVFIKRPGDGPTLWHSDLNMSPFDTNDFITCWIPLQDVPANEDGGSGLSYATASHRDFALPYWSDPTESDLDGRYDIIDHGAYQLGDCSFHHGWCLHSAPGNDRNETRYALSISFVADNANLLNSIGHIRYPDNEDYQSYSRWIDDIGWGGVAEHPLTPIVYKKT
eukprot:gene4525-6390_t